MVFFIYSLQIFKNVNKYVCYLFRLIFLYGDSYWIWWNHDFVQFM